MIDTMMPALGDMFAELDNEGRVVVQIIVPRPEGTYIRLWMVEWEQAESIAATLGEPTSAFIPCPKCSGNGALPTPRLAIEE